MKRKMLQCLPTCTQPFWNMTCDLSTTVLCIYQAHCVQEIDYKLEGQNADRFRKCFADTPWVKVPEIIWEASSSEASSSSWDLIMMFC